MVMQRGHAGTTLTSLQSRALTMLPKHNNLNKHQVISAVKEGRIVCTIETQ
jgi:hypothetical protein